MLGLLPLPGMGVHRALQGRLPHPTSQARFLSHPALVKHYWCFTPASPEGMLQPGIPPHGVWHSCHLLPEQGAGMEMLLWFPSPTWQVLPDCGPPHSLPAEVWPAYLRNARAI